MKYTDWTSGEPVEKEWPDPREALREALDALDIMVERQTLTGAVRVREIVRAALAHAAPPPDDAWMEGRKQGKDRERTLEQENDLLRRQLAQAAPPPETDIEWAALIADLNAQCSDRPGTTGPRLSHATIVTRYFAQAAPPPRPPTEAEEYEALYEHPMPQAAPPPDVGFPMGAAHVVGTKIVAQAAPPPHICGCQHDGPCRESECGHHEWQDRKRTAQAALPPYRLSECPNCGALLRVKQS